MRARVRIESIAAGGDGVAHSDGLAVFVPRTAPGDVVDVELIQQGRFARANVISLHERSSVRVEPPCVHYERDRCGGCQLQHMHQQAQLDAKRGIVRDALHRIGKVSAPVPEVSPAPSAWRYRISLTLAIRRDGSGRAASWRFGLRDYDDPEKVFDLEECLISDGQVLSAWNEIRAAAFLLPDAARMSGTVRWLDDGATFSLRGGSIWTQQLIGDFSRACPAISVAHWSPDYGVRRVLWDTRTDPTPPAFSFTQVNPGVAEQLHADVATRVLAHNPRTAVDAYSGVGDVAVVLARAGVTVTAIEVDKDAAQFAASRLTRPSRSIAARVEQALHRALPADVVVLNPPRAGIDASVAETLNSTTPKPRAIVYVSCDPATLTRDVRRLSTFTVASVQPYDMFPQTAHVETVCELVPIQ
ncbi:MAG: class I SAM-dependent RNA methyltransferase [Gemmatimonadaceae bacterium]